MVVIGIDVGGTHTDGVVISNQEVIRSAKVLTDHDNLFNSITEIINKLTENIQHDKIKKITLSTTLTTNQILEKKLPPTGLIISGGPGINLENFLIDENSYILEGAIDHRGRVIRALKINDIEPIIDELIHKEVETVAVCTKFSPRNPTHENLIKERMSTKFLYITCGHTISGNLNFPRRINTSFLNSASFKKNKFFLDSINKFLKENNYMAQVFILKADGGTLTLKDAYKFPVMTILSGAAAGVSGVMSVKDIPEETVAVIDIGGTSSDVSIFINNSPLFENEGIKIGEQLTLVRSVYSYSFGLGGDSLIKLENDEILIGPERKDVAIAFGGKYLTPTDIVFYLNKLPTHYMDKIEFELKKMALKLNISEKEMAEKIFKKFSENLKKFLDTFVEELNNKPLYTIKELVGFRNIKIDKIYLMGGPAKNFKSLLEKNLKMPIEVVPYSDVINAIGAAVSKNTYEMTLFADTTVNQLIIPEIEYVEKIDSSFSFNECIDILDDSFGSNEYEIIEKMEFNVISGFYRSGKTFRVKAQVKPGVEIFLKN